MTKSLQFLSGGGEMAVLMRTYNWESSTLGPADEWPQSLRTTLGILLNSKFPMFLYWGADLVCFYNDAYRFSLGNDGKHPLLLGMKGEEAWPETWHIVKPPIDQVLKGGEATWSEDQFVPIYREGKLKDAYWTFSFSPVKNESNETAGVFLTLIETTEKVNNLKNLIETNDQLGFAIEATELGTFDLNPLTNKFIANNRLKDWFGLPHEREVDLTLAIDVMVEKDRSRVANAIQKTLQYESGGLYDIEYSILDPLTKQDRIVRAKGRAWFGDDKKAYRFNGTLQDITEQSIAKIKLEESEERFRNLILQAPVLITTFEGPSNRVTTINKKALEVLGKSYGQVINKPLFEVSPETEDGLKTIFTNIYDTGEAFIANEYMVQLKRPGKPETAYFNSVYQPLRDADYKIYGIISIGTEVTETVNARKQIEESEKRFSNILSQSIMAIGILKGTDMVVTFANDPIIATWGKGGDIIGKPLFEVLPELRSQGFPELLHQVYTTGVPYYGYEVKATLIRNGKEEDVYYNFVYQPYTEVDNSITGITILATDVTEQVLAKKQIEAGEKRFSNMLMQSLMGICIFEGPEMVVAFANEPILTMWAKENVIGKSLLEFLPEVKDQIFPKLLLDVYTTGVAFATNEIRAIINRNGKEEECYFNIIYQPYRDVDDAVTGITVFATEVTESVFAKRQIEASEKRFSNILSQSLMAIAIFKGPEMVVEFANEPMINVLGKGNAVLNKPLLEGVPELKDQVFPQLLADVYTTGVAYEGIETKAILVRNGIPVDAYFNFVYQPYRDVDDTITGITVLATDVTEQVHAKKQIEESEKRISNILSQSIMSIGILKGADMVVTLANEPLLKIWGKTQDIVGKPLFEVMPELASQAFPKQLNDVFTTGIPYTFNENRAILMNNRIPEERFFSVVIQPYTEVDNTISGVTVIGTEVTDYVQAKKQIEENEAEQKKLASQLKLATDSANIGIWSLDVVLSKLQWSETHKMMWGYNAPYQDVTYEDWHKAILPEDKELAFKKIEESKVNHSIYDVEYRIHKADDHDIRSIRSVGKYYYNDEGEAETLTGISIDITEQKQAQEKITESEKQFRIFADNIQNLAWIANADGWIYFYNQQWYDYTGTTLKEMEGSGWQKVHHPDKVEQVSKFLKEAWKKDEPFEITCRLRRDDGEYRWFLTRGYPVKDAYGNIERWIGTNTDIHEQKTKEQQKDDFISIASHEMKTPLTTAKGYLELLQLQLSEENQTALLYANKANGAVERLNSLVTELLDASKIQNGKLDYNITTFDFNEMMDEAIGNIQLTAKNHTIQKTGNSVHQIKGDKERLQQVMINLLSNAVKYSPDGEKVFIKVEEQHGNIQVSVQDFGVGMSSQHLDKVFDRYYRVEEHAVHFQGLGIGLYISSNIIQRHEGKMWVDSEPGKGSIFYFTLPLNY